MKVARRCSTRWLPIKPAPPVIRMDMCAGGQGSGVRGYMAAMIYWGFSHWQTARQHGFSFWSPVEGACRAGGDRWAVLAGDVCGDAHPDQDHADRRSVLAGQAGAHHGVWAAR